MDTWAFLWVCRSAEKPGGRCALMVVPNPLRQTVRPATLQIPVFSLVPLISPKTPINYSEMLERTPSEQHSVLWAQTTSGEWAHVPYLQPTVFPVNSHCKSKACLSKNFLSSLLAVHVFQTLKFLGNTLHIIVTYTVYAFFYTCIWHTLSKAFKVYIFSVHGIEPKTMTLLALCSTI